MRGRVSIGFAPILALLAAACSGSAGPQFAVVRGPTSVVAFLGMTHAKPGSVVPYLAIAASRGDELKIFDPENDAVVRSPGVAFPLAVPTMIRPLRLAAAPLNDADGSPLPDVLLVSGTGAVVQLVSTWEDGSNPDSGMSVVGELDLSPWAGTGAVVLSMVGAPVPGTVVAPPGAIPVAPAIAGRGRVLVGFSGSSDGQGGKLVVLDFERDLSDPSVAGKVKLAAEPLVQHLGFDPVELSLSPDNFHLYCASPDPITDTGGARTVFGVGEVTMGTDASVPWTVRGLNAGVPGSAGVPTTLVAAAIVGERIQEVIASQGDPPFGAPVPRVYAALDPSACGPQTSISCGVVTIDPARGGLADEIAPPGGGVPAQTYRAPMQIPGVPLAMAVGMPPLLGTAQKMSGGPTSTFPDAVAQPLLRIGNFGERWTTALMVVASSSGPSWILDLGRTWTPDTVSMLQDPTRTKVSTAVSTPGPGGTARPVLDPLYGTGGTITADGDLPAAFEVTPGFTPTETWSIVYQGPLPNLLNRRGVISRDSLSTPWLAIQNDVTTNGGLPAWVPGASLDDPRLGIQVGDVVAFTVAPASDDPCPPVAPATYHELRVAAILPPDPVTYPGGALQLVDKSGNTDGPAFCFFGTGSAARDTVPVAVTIGAQLWVLTGARTGYAGRPVYKAVYSLEWQTEEPLLAACPLLQDPSPSPMPACDSSCRQACENLVLARKARRTDYPAEACPLQGALCYPTTYPEMTNPLQAGPVLRFKLDVTDISGGLTRGATLAFASQSGMVQMSRQPGLLSQGTSAIAFDKSRYANQQSVGMVFYVTYMGDALFEFPPEETETAAITIR